jgi:hypothetical protein
MSRYIRSAKGEVVDFELLAIKAQLAATPLPKAVADRKAAIDAKDGKVQPQSVELAEMMAAATEAAQAAESSVARRRK